MKGDDILEGFRPEYHFSRSRCPFDEGVASFALEEPPQNKCCKSPLARRSKNMATEAGKTSCVSSGSCLIYVRGRPRTCDALV